MKKISLPNQDVYTCWANTKPVDEPRKTLKKCEKILKDLDKEIFNLNGEFRFISEAR